MLALGGWWWVELSEEQCKMTATLRPAVILRLTKIRESTRRRKRPGQTLEYEKSTGINLSLWSGTPAAALLWIMLVWWTMTAPASSPLFVNDEVRRCWTLATVALSRAARSREITDDKISTPKYRYASTYRWIRDESPAVTETVSNRKVATADSDSSRLHVSCVTYMAVEAGCKNLGFP